MEKVTLVVPLIDRAAKVLGSDYKVAQALGVPRQTVSNWRHGSKNAQPEDAALLASIAGLDAEAWLIRALLDKHAGTAKGARLAVALGKGSPATTEASGSSGQHPGPTGRPESGLPRCIFRDPCYVKKQPPQTTRLERVFSCL